MKLFSAEDAALLRQVADAIPEKNTLIHGDFHEGNVMLQNGELMLIDLDDVCVGNPVYDLIAHHTLHKATTRDVAMLSLNLEPELIPVIADYERRAYLGTEESEALERYVKTMNLFYPLRMLLVIATEVSNRAMTPENVHGIKKVMLPRFRESAPRMMQAAGQLS